MHIDARGLACPLPIVELSKAIKTDAADIVTIDVDDPAAEVDIPAWCRMRGHSHASAIRQGDFVRHTVRINRPEY